MQPKRTVLQIVSIYLTHTPSQSFLVVTREINSMVLAGRSINVKYKNVSWVGKERARKRPTKREGRADHGVENGVKRRRLVPLSSLPIAYFLFLD